MSIYRRWFVAGGTYFFTIVTQGRRPILNNDQSRRYLRNAIGEVRKRFSFDVIATVLLPDHWHLVMQLPPGESNYSIRIKRIKTEFTRQWIDAGNPESNISFSRQRRGARGVWQARFWELTVRDEFDLERCCDYIHWNPVKHDMVSRAYEWPWSSFRKFVAEGHYDPDWGKSDPETLRQPRDWGE